jgi:hypothetical protein
VAGLSWPLVPLMKSVELAMSLAGTVLQAYLCLVLVARKFYREFRFFTLCTAVSVVTAIALILVRNHGTLYFHQTLYFYVYWTSEALSVVLIFFALQEAFYLVFRNFLSIPGFRWLFPGIGIVMLAIATARALLHASPNDNLLTDTLISLEIAVNFLQVGIFFLFTVLVRFFHMRSRQHAFGVVLGFGIAAAGTLIVLLLRSEFGTKLDPIVRITPPLAYSVTVVVWLATFLRAEPSHPMQDRVLALTPEQMLFEIRRYTRAVKGILER